MMGAGPAGGRPARQAQAQFDSTPPVCCGHRSALRHGHRGHEYRLRQAALRHRARRRIHTGSARSTSKASDPLRIPLTWISSRCVPA